MGFLPPLENLVETLIGLGDLQPSRIEADQDFIFPGTIVAYRVAAVEWYPPMSGGGGGPADSLWVDDPANGVLRPLTGGRGINLGSGDVLADIIQGNQFTIGTPGQIQANASGQLRIEGPNGVEVTGLELTPIGTILPVAGMLQWTGTALQFYDGTQWITIGGIPPGGPNGDPIGYWLDDVGQQMLYPAAPNHGVRLPAGGDGLIIAHSTYPTIDRRTGVDADDNVLILHGGSMGTFWKTWDSTAVLGYLTNAGNLRLGDVTTPTERLELATGGIRVGLALADNQGTIQYSVGHFYGRTPTGWVQLDNTTGIPPGDPGNPLAPTGVVPGVYGDALNIPVLDVHADGRIYVASEIPLTTSIIEVLGPVNADLHGSWPNLFLNDISPPIPAGTYGDATHLPTFTVNTQGRITQASHSLIRGARDPMAPVYVTRFWPEDLFMAVGPNSLNTMFLTPFVPLATGRGRLHGVVSGFMFNSETNPDIGTLHTCWAIIYVLIDGVQKARIRRSVNLWEPGGGGGHAVDAPLEIPFSIPWTEDIGNTHLVTVQVRNFRNYNEIVDSVYPMTFQADWCHLLIEEDAEPGVGTNSSYLMAGAVMGPTAAGAIGSWIAAYTFLMPASLGGSWAKLKVPAGGSVSFDIQVNGVTKGQINWTGGSAVGTFTFPTAVTIAVGDRIEVIGVGGVSDPTWTLRGIL